MRPFSRPAAANFQRVSLALRRCANKKRPTAVPGAQGHEVVAETVPAAGGASSHSYCATNSSVHTASGRCDETTGQEHGGQSPNYDLLFQTKGQRTGSHAQGWHLQPQRGRPRRRTSRTAYADEELVAAEEAGGARDTRGSVMLPVVHPGADLPPLRQRPLTEKRIGKFSYVSDPSQRRGRDVYGNEVPNNTPKPKLPMWASSLTSPALGKVRLTEESWISRDARGVLADDITEQFVHWLCGTVLPADSVLKEQLTTNVLLDLRRATARGVYAKKAFKRGDVVLTIPLLSAISSKAPRGIACFSLNSETLAKYSTAARQRVGLPSYDTVKQVLSVRRSSFDPIPHPLFLDQVCAALLLACERADGEASPLHPYLQLLDTADLFNDESIRELHLGVLDPTTHMEYDEHVKRFQHYMRRLHAVWWAAYASATGQGSGAEVASEAAPRADTTATLGSSVPTLGVDEEGSATLVTIDTEGIDSKDIGNRAVVPADAKASNMDSSAAQMAWRPPPSVEDMVWALRVILSRQKVLPHLRVDRTALAHVREENVEGEVLDSFGKAVMKGKYSFYQHILHAIDEDRLHVNEVDPTAIPTLVPLLDMVSHPPGGVPNVSYTVEKVEGTGEGADALLVDVNESSDRAALMRGKSPRAPPCYQLVVRATDDIEEDEELTASYVKCYSVAYTLYRYGFLPLSRREDDVAALLEANRVDGNTRPVPTGGSSPSSLSRDCVRSVFRSWWPSMFAQ